MVFSSIEFLFYFLPVVLIGYFVFKRWRRAEQLMEPYLKDNFLFVGV